MFARWREANDHTRRWIEEGLHPVEAAALRTLERNLAECGPRSEWTENAATTLNGVRLKPKVLAQLVDGLEIREEAYPDFLRALRLMVDGLPSGAEHAADTALREHLADAWARERKPVKPEPVERKVAEPEPAKRDVFIAGNRAEKVEERLRNWLRRQRWTGFVLLRERPSVTAAASEGLCVHPRTVERVLELWGWELPALEDEVPSTEGEECEMALTQREIVERELQERGIDLLTSSVTMPVQRSISEKHGINTKSISAIVSTLRTKQKIEQQRAAKNGVNGKHVDTIAPPRPKHPTLDEEARTRDLAAEVWPDGGHPPVEPDAFEDQSDEELVAFVRTGEMVDEPKVAEDPEPVGIARCPKTNPNPLRYVTDGPCEREAGHEGRCVWGPLLGCVLPSVAEMQAALAEKGEAELEEHLPPDTPDQRTPEEKLAAAKLNAAKGEALFFKIQAEEAARRANDYQQKIIAAEHALREITMALDSIGMAPEPDLRDEPVRRVEALIRTWKAVEKDLACALGAVETNERTIRAEATPVRRVDPERAKDEWLTNQRRHQAGQLALGMPVTDLCDLVAFKRLRVLLLAAQLVEVMIEGGWVE